MIVGGMIRRLGGEYEYRYSRQRRKAPRRLFLHHALGEIRSIRGGLLDDCNLLGISHRRIVRNRDVRHTPETSRLFTEHRIAEWRAARLCSDDSLYELRTSISNRPTKRARL